MYVPAGMLELSITEILFLKEAICLSIFFLLFLLKNDYLFGLKNSHYFFYSGCSLVYLLGKKSAVFLLFLLFSDL